MATLCHDCHETIDDDFGCACDDAAIQQVEIVRRFLDGTQWLLITGSRDDARAAAQMRGRITESWSVELRHHDGRWSFAIMPHTISTRACGTCLGSGTEARDYTGSPWAIPTCRACNGRGTITKGES